MNILKKAFTKEGRNKKELSIPIKNDSKLPSKNFVVRSVSKKATPEFLKMIEGLDNRKFTPKIVSEIDNITHQHNQKNIDTPTHIYNNEEINEITAVNLNSVQYPKALDPYENKINGKKDSANFGDTASYHSINSFDENFYAMHPGSAMLLSQNEYIPGSHSSVPLLPTQTWSLQNNTSSSLLKYASVISVRDTNITNTQSEELPPGFKQKMKRDGQKKLGIKEGKISQSKKLADKAQKYYDFGILFHDSGDLQTAVAYYKKSADLNNYSAILYYGLALRHGWGVDINIPLSFVYLQKAADHVLRDTDEKPKIARTQTENENFPMAVYELGQSYYHGWGVQKSTKIAMKYFKLSSDLGYPPANIDLAICYEKGNGVKRDLKTSAHYYRLAHSQGIDIFGNSWIFKKKYGG
ncbi:hypothetical protein BB558_004678 [Smittium angustum]|uniref:Uncharacterized protein n=1 Tax=Smittium angustum TaxID=133377 RepID=A0A2U1J2K3_SMIAN|nr:hypothetical protein BB558_006586 [Smittium angustum]PVZ99311.1 hypothetical protein BB558_004678 [Smittium angustum]